MIAALFVAALLASPASELDGQWCRDGHRLTIAGSRVTVDDGRGFTGYVVDLPPARRPGPGVQAMLGLDRQLPQGTPVHESPDTTLALGTDGELRLMGFDFGSPPASGPLETWSRCAGPGSPIS